MNFLHIHTTDIKGGAAIENYRLHKALLKKEYGSHILCGRGYSSGKDVSCCMPGKHGWVLNAIVGKIFNDLGLQSFGCPSSVFVRFSKRINKWADIIILRNLHGWYLSLGRLARISKKVPIIWRLPDMWALTGHCAYSYDCQNWKAGCGNCPDLSSYPGLLIDTTRFLWERKKAVYQKMRERLVFVSPSKWLMNFVKFSPLTKDFRCEYIPTAVDLNIFKPCSRERSRQKLGIEKNEKVIMFSSAKLKDKRKGIDILWGVLKRIADRRISGVTLLLVGYKGEKISFPSGIKVKKIRFVKEDDFLAVCYNASDLYLSLSRADNLPNTLVEATACGLPIVTLDNGGCGETIEQGRSGYAVKSISEACEAVEKILTDVSLRESFSANARKFAESNFSMDLQVQRYTALAKQMITATKK
jgi:glycosyltransferase involved in cell wall biosynthesis